MSLKVFVIYSFHGLINYHRHLLRGISTVRTLRSFFYMLVGAFRAPFIRFEVVRAQKVSPKEVYGLRIILSSVFSFDELFCLLPIEISLHVDWRLLPIDLFFFFPFDFPCLLPRIHTQLVAFVIIQFSYFSFQIPFE